MKNLSPLLAALFLIGCNGGPGPIDAQKFLSGLDGPKVPTMQDTQLEAAKNAEAQGDFAGAAQIYQQIMEKHPEDMDTALKLADAYRRGGEPDRALPIYDALLKQNAGNVAAKEGKGLALMSKGDFDTPVALFQEVVKAEPNRWKTLNALGILFTTRNMQPEAQQYFAAALKNNPGSASITNNIGLSQALDRHYDAAIDTLGKAGALAQADSQHKRIDLNLALVYAIAGKIDDARSITEKYYSGAALDNNMGLYEHLAKDDQLAKTYLNMAVTESKVFYPKAWDNLQAIDSTADDGSDSVTPPAGNTSKKSGKNKHRDSD